MLYMGYFAKLRTYVNLKPYAISNSVPKGINIGKIKDFVPKWEIVDGYKKGTLSEEGYTELYIEQLDAIDTNTLNIILDDLKRQDSILICYEKVGSFCHRNILAKWLSNYGLEVKEYVSEES